MRFCTILLLLAGCRRKPSARTEAPVAQPHPRVLTLAAAADLKFALDQVSAAFQAVNPGTELRITYGSSGNFYSQLVNKAPFDVFLSADVSYPDKLISAGLAPRRSEFRYGVGRIVVWVANDSRLDISRGLDALLDPSIRKIAIANPRHAPYGRAAQAALEARHLWGPLQPKIVLGENIAQTTQFVKTGAAEAGIIALSLALAPQMKHAGRYHLIAQRDYPPLVQAGLILPWSPDPAAAQSFRGFLTGPTGRAILKTYGFQPP